jgi:hypothetical protein
MSGHRQITCPDPNCGYKGIAKEVEHGSPLMGPALLMLGIAVTLFNLGNTPANENLLISVIVSLTRSVPFLLPWILYLIFYRGYRYYCPKCGIQVGSKNKRWAHVNRKKV